MLRFPAEWEPQEAILLTWPHAFTDWANQLSITETVYWELVRYITARQKVLIACHNETLRTKVAQGCASYGIKPQRIGLFIAPCNDTWARDHGPICVYDDGQRQLLDFTFNAWGGKYNADLDNAISRRLHAAGAFGDTPLLSVPWVLEGGGIESDGAGTLLTTGSCLLAPTRNPTLNQAGVEAMLYQWLGVKRVLWLNHGQLAGDDTDGHIDTLARFADPNTIVYQGCDDKQHPNYVALQAMAEELNQLRTATGQPYRLLELPWPGGCFNAEGSPLPATYANFLLINGAVLMPSYHNRADDKARQVLLQAFPQRDIITVDCRALIEQFGSLHCITMHIPLQSASQ